MHGVWVVKIRLNVAHYLYTLYAWSIDVAVYSKAPGGSCDSLPDP